jgi:hypothetical protein
MQMGFYLCTLVQTWFPGGDGCTVCTVCSKVNSEHSVHSVQIEGTVCSKVHSVHSVHMCPKSVCMQQCPKRFDMPSAYGTGCAKSDLTSCLPVPWGCWGLMGRSKGADYRVPDFEEIGVWTCLATAIESARIIWAGSNWSQSPSHAHCTRRIRVC